MEFNLLSLNEKYLWNKLLNRLPDSSRDIYYTPEYYDLYEKNNNGRAKCFILKNNEDIVLYPFLINSINELDYDLDEDYYDIQGAYGYNGIVSSSYKKETEKIFTTLFKEYCLDNNIVSEFTRFHPIIKNHQFSCHLQPIFDQNNVIVDLEISDFFKFSYEHSVRKNINKAQRNDLGCIVIEGEQITKKYIATFLKIYYDTMRRNEADSFYYFPNTFINRLFEYLGNKSRLYFTLFKDEFISTEIVLYGEKYSYSFLGGTNAQYYEFRPNDFLKNYIIHDLKNLGLKYFCLGGGNEGVFRFKKSFAKNGVFPFYIGKKIHNQKIYDFVINQWEKKFPSKVNIYKNLLLKYRY